jgi:flagellar M-ring protein FliF
MFNETARETDPIPQGIPGIQSNMPETSPAQNKTTEGENTTFAKQDRTVNYEIGKLTSSTLEPVGTTERISVAVLVDGTYQSNTKENGEQQWVYVPRASEELTKIENLVKSAVNFVADRGDKVEVVNIPFETAKIGESQAESMIESWLSKLKNYKPYFKYTFLSLFLILTFIFVVQPLIRWLTSNPNADAELLAQLPKTVGEIEGEHSADPKRLTFKDQISQLVANDNEASVGVMRDWLKEQ